VSKFLVSHYSFLDNNSAPWRQFFIHLIDVICEAAGQNANSSTKPLLWLQACTATNGLWIMRWV